jgi:hypothetical protein
VTGGKLELWFEGAAVARLFIHRFRMRVGAAVVRAAGIGGVATDLKRIFPELGNLCSRPGG